MATVCMPSSNVTLQEKECEPWLPPGFRFHPTDEELVSYYLTRKVMNTNFAVHAISEVDLNKCEPWDLPEKAKMGEKEWYFFSLRDRKYPTGMRTNRATDAGYWKATGKDRDVVSSRLPHVVGMKKTLVFYLGRAPKGEKTNWIMHEYRLEGDSNHLQSSRMTKDEWVVCRIFQKSAGSKKSFLFTENSRMGHSMQYHLDDALPSSLLDHSPNPTISDEGVCTDCDTCTANDQVSCYRHDQPQEAPIINHKEDTAPPAWTSVGSRSEAGLPGSAAMGMPGVDLLGRSGQTNNTVKYPGFDPNFNMPRLRQEMPSLPQAFGHTNLMSLKSLDPASFRASLKQAKLEPYAAEGEDEAQSSQRSLDYTSWGADNLVFHDGTGGIPLQNLTEPESSCVTESLCGDQPSLYRFNRYGLPDVPSVDSLECLWAY